MHLHSDEMYRHSRRSNRRSPTMPLWSGAMYRGSCAIHLWSGAMYRRSCAMHLCSREMHPRSVTMHLRSEGHFRPRTDASDSRKSATQRRDDESDPNRPRARGQGGRSDVVGALRLRSGVLSGLPTTERGMDDGDVVR